MTIGSARVRVASLLIALAAIAPAAFAATDVTVTVAQGGVGVPGAFVAVIGAGTQKFVGVTDSTGIVTFAQLPDGTFTVLASGTRTGAGSAALSTPGETTKTVTVTGTGTVLSPLPAFGSLTGALVPDGLSGVFYLNTSGIPGIYRTTDYGGTWTPATISGDDNTFGIDGSTTASLLTTSGYPGELAAVAGSPAKAFYSRDFGVTWSAIPLPASTVAGSKLLWSHPTGTGALSMLFYAPTGSAAMHYAAMPTGATNTPPTGFTAMTIGYRASASDPIAIANGSDAGVVIVGATTTSSAPVRVAGQIKLYRISATPNGNSDINASIDNPTVPGSVPILATDGTTALLPTDLFQVRVGGPLSGLLLGTTTVPNTLIVYSDKSTEAASNASITTCAGNVCTAPAGSTVFRDAADSTAAGAFASSSTTPPAVYCGATHAANPIESVSPQGSAGTIGGCAVASTGGAVNVRQVLGISSVPGMVFDAAFNGASNNVVLAGEGSKGPIKSTRAGTIAAEGVNRPYFPPYPAQAAAGMASTSGGVAINGLTSAAIRDIAFNPSSASQLATVMSLTDGGRVVGSTDAGKTWFDIFGLGGESLGWWNVGSGTQWLLGGVGSSSDLLGAAGLTTGSPFSASTTMTQITGTTAANLGVTSTGTGGVNIVPAVEGIAGTNSAIVAAGRTTNGSASNGFAEGSLALVTLSSPGPTASVSPISGGHFTGSAPVALAYCDPASAASVADRMFVAMASSQSAGASGGVKVITNTSQGTRAIASLVGITGDFRAIRADCATGTVWAGKNTVAPGGANGSGIRGLLRSTDGGSTFATIAATGRAGDILQKVRAIAIDPRAPSHVVVMSTDTDLVETKDGGFTWTVLNDSTTAACPTTFIGPGCGRAFGFEPGALEMPPKVAGGGGSVTTSESDLRATSQINADQAVVGSGAGLYSAFTRSILRSSLTFSGVVKSGTPIISSAQQVSLSFAVTGVNWTATSDQPFVVVSPASGTGSRNFTVSINNTSGAGVQPGTYAATITVQTTGALVSTQTIPVLFVVVANSAAPFGVMDTPADQASGLQGSIPVTGWALDDIEIDRVEIWRDLQSGETTPPVVTNPPTDPRNGKVFISNATFVDGARPDVESQYPTTPQNYRAGWGYLMLTWGLWNQGNGPYTLYAFAFDKDGNVATIGTKQINVNNNAANKPFGSVDTPGIGATIGPGTVANFGWGLTPKVGGAATCKIQPAGVQVSIDSGPLQPVVYGDVRSDIAGAFAGFSNSSAAGGHYIIDTSLYANGVHTIGWLITDDCTRADGVGSRFFNIQNGSSQVAGSTAALAPSVQVQVAASRADSLDAVTVAHGYGNLPATVTPDATGLRMVHVVQGDRIEVRLPGGYDQAFQKVNGVQRALPVGTTWDPASGLFYWQPGAAFLGSYEVVFVRNGEQIRVRVFVGSK
jgi:hypothetical protein